MNELINFPGVATVSSTLGNNSRYSKGEIEEKNKDKTALTFYHGRSISLRSNAFWFRERPKNISKSHGCHPGKREVEVRTCIPRQPSALPKDSRKTDTTCLSSPHAFSEHRCRVKAQEKQLFHKNRRLAEACHTAPPNENLLSPA